MKRTIIATLCIMLSFTCQAQSRLGADHAAPAVAAFLDAIPAMSGKAYQLSESQTDSLLSLAVTNKINVFELLDCIYRNVSARHGRVTINGAALRKLESRYDLGGERILAILPVDKLDYLETGALLDSDDRPLDIYLVSPHESRLDIGTAYYRTRFGFASVSPLEFSSAYGITVKKLVFSAPLEKLELYEPGKGAIYVGGMSKPKRWNLDVVTEKHR
jgi:hypothetical protein